MERDNNYLHCIVVVGYAVDPSIDSAAAAVPKIVGAAPDGQADIKTVFETIPKRPKDKRKREKNDCPEDVEGFLGPWGGYIDEEKVSKPNEVIKSRTWFLCGL